MKKVTSSYGSKTKIFVILSALVASAGALAAVDTTAALAEVDLAETAIIAVGSALIVLAAVVLGIRWVKAMFF